LEPQNYLGIYISSNAATVVCLQGRERNPACCFSVSVEQAEGRDLSAVADLIAHSCAEKVPEYRTCEVSVALDCAMFMQHRLRSEFTDPKRIAATVRFDTEEALATDVTDVAIAFRIDSSDQSGSALDVFTAQRKVLSELLVSLQRNNIDPVTIEPDIHCLARFISHNVSLPVDSRPFFGLLSRRNGYFIVPRQGNDDSQKRSVLRTFLVGPAQNRGKLLAGDIPVTMALAGAAKPINCLRVFDATGSVDCRQLGEELGIETGPLDLAQSAAVDPQTLGECPDLVDFAIAYGAALVHLERAEGVNFRSDFMPYQGRKLRLQKALKFASYSVAVLLFAVGLYFQLQLFQTNKYRSRLRNKFAKTYSTVMFGHKMPAQSAAAKKLADELRRIRNVKSGQLSITGEEAISAKLTMVFEAFNKCAAQANLNIDTVSITTKSISIAGDTSSRQSTLELRKALEAAELGNLQDRLESKAGRDSFQITIVPAR
jgi:hypothetical protein